MSGKMQYHTKQQDLLLTFLREAGGRHMTVAEITELLRERGAAVGTTTVYRSLEKLVAQGMVIKYAAKKGAPACFEYVGESAEPGGDIQYHCICNVCGRLIHLHCEEIEGLAGHLREEHGFELDMTRTVLYGVCEDCRRKADVERG